MGTNQTKAAGSDPGTCSLLGFWRRTQSSLVLRRRSSGERVGRVCTPPPYQRRVGLIQELLVTVKAGRREEAIELLKTLRQDLGMEATSLDEVLQSSTSLGNLVDPITHQLILMLVRYVHCPKTEGESLSAMEKVCRQLTYHLSPHSQWRRQGLFGNKPQPSLKSSLSGPPVGGAVELSGISLSLQDMELLSAHLRLHSPRVRSLELGFTGLTDRALLLLVPSLAALPALETLVLNGNRLTRAVLRPLTDLLADPTCFPALTWMDLGNNEDIVSLPQAFLKGLRRRCPEQGRLPTIQEQEEELGGGHGRGGGETGSAEMTCCCRAVEGEEEGDEGEEGGKDGEEGEEWGEERGREWGEKGDKEDKGLRDSAADRTTEEEHGNKTPVAHRELGESSIQTSQPTGTDK